MRFQFERRDEKTKQKSVHDVVERKALETVNQKLLVEILFNRFKSMMHFGGTKWDSLFTNYNPIYIIYSTTFILLLLCTITIMIWAFSFFYFSIKRTPLIGCKLQFFWILFFFRSDRFLLSATTIQCLTKTNLHAIVHLQILSDRCWSRHRNAINPLTDGDGRNEPCFVIYNKAKRREKIENRWACAMPVLISE